MGALGDKVEQTVQTNGYQDPLEEQFDKEQTTGRNASRCYRLVQS
jgi:hypothetical protein